jgi:hypothetical protein
MEMKKVFALVLLAAAAAMAQQPQTQTAPPFATNSQWVNGVAPGYAPTAGSGLTLNLSAGTAFCGGSVITYAAGTLTMTASATNNVYLNTGSSCVPAVKTGAFVAADIPIAQVTTSGSAITAIADLRTMFVPAGTSGGSLSVAGSSGDLQTNNGSSNLGASHINDNGSRLAVTEPLLATGIIDGKAPITIVTTTTFNFGSTYNSGYTYCEDSTSTATCTGTLPTAAAGLQFCMMNGYNGSAMTTGADTFQTSAPGQYIIYDALGASGGYIVSAGAAGDGGCVVGVDSTHWQFYPQGGTWTLH